MRPSEVLPLHRETIRQLVLEAGMANRASSAPSSTARMKRVVILTSWLILLPRRVCWTWRGFRFVLNRY
jgi:hypothetical protein